MGTTRWSDDHYRDRAKFRAHTGSDAFAHDHAIRTGSAEAAVQPKMNPGGVTVRESRDSDAHPDSHAVAVLFDVTGSMQRVPRILQANLPKLMGLLLRKGYLDHPQILIGAIGDATCDTAPLQVGQFESGIEIDEDLGRLFLEGGGGGQITESYELALYFMARHTALDCYEKRGRRGYLFVIGDEAPYPRVKRREVAAHIGDQLQRDIPVEEVLAKLQRTYDVYYVVPKMTHHWDNRAVQRRWVKLLGQNVLRLEDPAGICELIASTVGLAEGKIDLEDLGDDLQDAGATTALARAVSDALAPLAFRTSSPGACIRPGQPGALMKRAIVTVGLGFGDEGKGATVDYLTRHFEADLVVRYCGGCQAGHNVQLPDGRRHTFSQFGAGTLAAIPARPRTYLGPHVIIDPLALGREARHLSDLGVQGPGQLLTIHPHCLVATRWHRVLNRLRELARGKAKHGSCGQGVGEARSYWLRHGADAVFAADLGDPSVLRHKLELQRQRALLECQDLLECVSGDDLQELDLWSTNSEDVACELSAALPDGVRIDPAIPSYRTAIFEGAQGVLLDEFRGFHPYTTWSTVTPHHAWELLEQMGVEAVAVLGITRAYATRHGEGPFPTFAPELTARLLDPGNPCNRWQGSLRCGWLDLPLLRYAAAVAGPLDGIVVNHLEQVRDSACQVCVAYRNTSLSPAAAPNLAWQSRLTGQLLRAGPLLSPATPDAILRSLSAVAPVVLTGSGPTHQERTFTRLSFRTRRSST
jgi:adenylosuccinate synthase